MSLLTVHFTPYQITQLSNNYTLYSVKSEIQAYAQKPCDLRLSFSLKYKG